MGAHVGLRGSVWGVRVGSAWGPRGANYFPPHTPLRTVGSPWGWAGCACCNGTSACATHPVRGVDAVRHGPVARDPISQNFPISVFRNRCDLGNATPGSWATRQVPARLERAGAVRWYGGPQTGARKANASRLRLMENTRSKTAVTPVARSPQPLRSGRCHAGVVRCGGHPGTYQTGECGTRVR